MQSFSVSVNDNDSFMCSSTDRVFDDVIGVKVCPGCHYRTNFEFVNQDFKIKRKTYDLSATYDGYYIASLKFKETLNREGITGINFVAISKEPEYFVMFVSNVVSFDTKKRKSRAEKFCSVCANYESYVGATPAFLKELPRFDLSRTDVAFGSGNAKHPLLIASESFVSLVKREKLKGLYFEPTRT
ncbi:conserved hypothetical protein [Shewanella sp. ANA-3]|uniref:hypothetical protein n=1 Tax=Shewanella sp. (strain ANA-3) TaxID=94122 RepID=UPI00005DE7CE|nr:hypothetical protein [Shewanella sp. ANA-3]ABK48626.1 conserved hypothetical protein [Shewanella sp. ANA-3]